MQRVVVITGGGHGIGRAYARRFAAESYDVVVADIDFDRAVDAVTELEADGGSASAVRADVSDEADCGGMAAHALERFGRIDVLINNAGLKGLSPGGRNMWEIDTAEWDRLMAVNVRGVWLATRAVLPAMRAQGGGSIINMASSVLLGGSTGFIHYAASKGAVLGFTRSAARELGEYNIRVNCIMAGYIPTEPWQLAVDPAVNEARRRGRIIKRDQVAEDLCGAAVFLASPESGYMSGQSVNIDGGRTHL
jgi:3-oxoacyl-[acyl-carrier protein] reductase